SKSLACILQNSNEKHLELYVSSPPDCPFSYPCTLRWKLNFMQSTSKFSDMENVTMQCGSPGTASAGVMLQMSPPKHAPPFLSSYQISRSFLYPFMRPYTPSFMHYIPTAYVQLHANNDEKKAEHQSPEVPPKQNKLYNTYAKRVGFGITVTDSRRKNDLCVYKRFNCHYGSQSRRGKDVISHRDSSKIGCKASVRVRHDKDTNTYIMYNVILEHNHILHLTAAMYFRSHRKICTPKKAEILNMRIDSWAKCHMLTDEGDMSGVTFMVSGLRG
ncbi:hypothetical protein Taro_054201, partial [Colocasia esculenta]|nr:hypothetical protein [Colocasia esculenta]